MLQRSCTVSHADTTPWKHSHVSSYWQCFRDCTSRVNDIFLRGKMCWHWDRNLLQNCNRGQLICSVHATWCGSDISPDRINACEGRFWFVTERSRIPKAIVLIFPRGSFAQGWMFHLENKCARMRVRACIFAERKIDGWMDECRNDRFTGHYVTR